MQRTLFRQGTVSSTMSLPPAQGPHLGRRPGTCPALGPFLSHVRQSRPCGLCEGRDPPHPLLSFLFTLCLLFSVFQAQWQSQSPFPSICAPSASLPLPSPAFHFRLSHVGLVAFRNVRFQCPLACGVLSTWRSREQLSKRPVPTPSMAFFTVTLDCVFALRVSPSTSEGQSQRP